MPKPNDMLARRGWGNFWEFFSPKNNRRIQTNSDLEYEVAIALEYDHMVVSYEYEPFRNQHNLPNIDFLINREGRRFFAECKYFEELERPEVRRQISRQKEYANAVSVSHIIFTERNLLTRIGIANMRLIIHWAAFSLTSVRNSSIQTEILRLLPCKISDLYGLGEVYEIQSSLSNLLRTGRAELTLEREPLKTFSVVPSPDRAKPQTIIKSDWGRFNGE